MSEQPKPRKSRLTIMRLAARAGVDPRSAERALAYGPESVRGLAGERLREAMEAMGLAPKTAA